MLAQPDGVRNHLAASKAETSEPEVSDRLACWDREEGGPGTMAEVTADKSWEWQCLERRCPLALSQQQMMTATAMMPTTKMAEAPGAKLAH